MVGLIADQEPEAALPEGLGVPHGRLHGGDTDLVRCRARAKASPPLLPGPAKTRTEPNFRPAVSARKTGLDPGGDVGPLGVQGDELAGQVEQHRAGSLGAGDGDGLPAQGRYNPAGPGGVAPGAVLLELGVDAGPAGLPQRGGGGPCGDDLQDGVVLQPRSQDGLQGGVDW